MKEWFQKTKDRLSKIKREGKLVVGTILFIFLGSTGMYYSNFKSTGNFYDMGRELDHACFIGDTGAGNPSQVRVAEKLREQCKDVFYLGDVIYPQGLENAEDPQFFNKFYDHYKGLNNYITLGNHDTYNTGQMKYWLELGKKYDDVFYPNYFYAVKFKNVCVLAFESSIYNVIGTGKFEKAQNEFIQEFTSREDCKIKIAISHHPYLSSGKHGDAFLELKSFYEKYLVGKVDYIIAGHDHNLTFEGCFDGTCHFVSGAGSKLRPCKKVRQYCCDKKFGFLKFVEDKLEFIKVD